MSKSGESLLALYFLSLQFRSGHRVIRLVKEVVFFRLGKVTCPFMGISAHIDPILSSCQLSSSSLVRVGKLNPLPVIAGGECLFQVRRPFMCVPGLAPTTAEDMQDLAGW